VWFRGRQSLCTKLGSSPLWSLFWFWTVVLNTVSSPWNTPPAIFFVMGSFKIRSLELFALAGFQPQSSWSLLPEKLGLQVWTTSAQPTPHFLMALGTLNSVPWSSGQKILLIFYQSFSYCAYRANCSLLSN
jgi:hypothetical protein